MPAPTVRSTSTYASAATETATSGLALPSGWQPGDVIYIGCELTAAVGSITTPGGWANPVPQFVSAVGSTPTSGHTAVFRRVMQSGDTAPTISFTSGRFAANLTAIQGADNTTPEDVTPTTDDNTGVTAPSVRASSITPVTPNCLLLTFHAIRNLTSGVLTAFTPDASETEQADAGTSVAAVSEAAIETASLALTGTSATGTKTATATGSNVTSLNMMGAAIAVRSATGTAPVAVVQRHTVQYARRMPRLIRPSAGFTPSAAAPAKPPIRPGRSPRPAAERSHNLRTAKWAPPVAETFQPLPALQRTSRKVLYWSAHRSPVQQQPGEPVAPISFVRRPRPWPARSRGSRAPVASVVVPPATTVPATLRGRSWRPILRIRSIQRAGPGATIIPAVPAPIGFIQRHLPWRRKLHISPQFIPGQIAAVIAPGVPQSAQPRRPRLAHKPQPATALRAQFPAPTVPILRGKAWRRRPVQVQFAPQKAVPPPAFVPQTWWRRIWLPFRKHPKPTSFAPGVPTGTPLPNTINCSTFVIRTLACEPTIARLLTGEAVVTNTLKCEARRV